jgi:hypothetical protein
VDHERQDEGDLEAGDGRGRRSARDEIEDDLKSLRPCAIPFAA